MSKLISCILPRIFTSVRWGHSLGFIGNRQKSCQRQSSREPAQQRVNKVTILRLEKEESHVSKYGLLCTYAICPQRNNCARLMRDHLSSQEKQLNDNRIIKNGMKLTYQFHRGCDSAPASSCEMRLRKLSGFSKQRALCIFIWNTKLQRLKNNSCKLNYMNVINMWSSQLIKLLVSTYNKKEVNYRRDAHSSRSTHSLLLVLRIRRLIYNNKFTAKFLQFIIKF